MSTNKRFELINLLESLMLKEDYETFLKKNNRFVHEDETEIFKKNWYKYSSTFTRMWLNYLTDDRLEKILNKKLADQNVDKGISELISKI